MTVQDLIEMLELFPKNTPINFYNLEKQKELYFDGLGYDGEVDGEIEKTTECTCLLIETNY